MKRTSAIICLLIVATFFPIQSAGANTLCNDGTISRSSGKGTCSWHGGIAGNSPRNNGFGTSSRNNGLSDPWGSTSRNNGFGTSSRNNGLSDPWGSTSRNNGFGTSSRNSGFCSYIDRSKGRC
jgi:hypothetical protein